MDSRRDEAPVGSFCALGLGGRVSRAAPQGSACVTLQGRGRKGEACLVSARSPPKEQLKLCVAEIGRSELITLLPAEGGEFSSWSGNSTAAQDGAWAGGGGRSSRKTVRSGARGGGKDSTGRGCRPSSARRVPSFGGEHGGADFGIGAGVDASQPKLLSTELGGLRNAVGLVGAVESTKTWEAAPPGELRPLLGTVLAVGDGWSPSSEPDCAAAYAFCFSWAYRLTSGQQRWHSLHSEPFLQSPLWK